MKATINDVVLTRSTPAQEWAEGLPLGNGRIGAMVWGSPNAEIVSLNHDLLWRRYLDHPEYGTSADIPEIRALCAEGKWREAEDVLLRTVPSTGEAIYINPFVPAFDLYLTMYQDAAAITDYTRILDMEHGVCRVSYQCGGIRYFRECFCEAGGEVFLWHLWASRPGHLTGEISLSRIPDCECTVTGGAEYGAVYCDAVFEEGVKFAAYSKIYHRGGRLTGGKKTYGIDGEAVPPKKFGLGYVFDRNESISAERGASVCIDSCDEVWIVTAVSVDKLACDPLASCKERASDPLFYRERYETHCTHFAAYYNRTRLTLGESAAELQEAYNMARYIAISSGMPCADDKAPINLQGLWNRDTRPAWESDYHLDLNIQMCYWPLAKMGLADFMEPYLSWMERLLPQARHCAADLYGAEGACYAGCCDPWTLGVTDNVGFGALGISAWLVQILWMYYEHDPHRELLDRILLLMREVDAFYQSMLVRDAGGHLITPFGSSPEMSLMLGEHRQWLSSPSMFDLTLICEFYVNFAAAASLCGDTEAENRCAELLSSLAEPVITDGILQEWTELHTEGEPGHRHRSPFAAFCPGTLYTRESHPAMTAAMERLLEKRLSYGNGMSTAFSYAWDAQILARLGHGDDAFAMLKRLLQIHALDNGMLTTNDDDGKNGGISWFTGTKVVQVEAQIASAAAMTELFYQDMQGIIRLLPALPEDIPDGSLTGIRGRGGVICDLAWKDGALSAASLTVPYDGICRILPPEDGLVFRCQSGEIAWGAARLLLAAPQKLCMTLLADDRTGRISFRLPSAFLRLL